MSIIGYITIISFMAGLQFVLTVALPIGLTLAMALFLVDRTRALVYRAAIDYLELSERLDSMRDNHARRDLALARAGLELRVERARLRSGEE